MDERIAAKVNTLLEDVYAAGVKHGREVERQEIVKSLSGAPRAARAPRTVNGANGGVVGATVAPKGELAQSINLALSALAESNQDGVFPDAIAGYLKERQGMDVSVAAVRQSLRQMTLSGHARRLARGRYSAIDRSPPPGTLFHQAPAA